MNQINEAIILEQAFNRNISDFREIEDITKALLMTAGVTITDSKGKITYVNDKFLEYCKYSRDELIGQNHRLIKSGFHSDETYKDLWTTIKQGKVWHSEIKNKAKDGTYFWADSTIVPFLNNNGIPYQYIAIRHDITKKKLYEESIKKLAFENSLTNLPNGRSLEIHLEKLCQNKEEKFAVLFFAINQFKSINDHFGFKTGDKVLVEIASQLLGLMKDRNGFVFHYSGNEFVLILGIHHISEATHLAEKILRAIDLPLFISNHPLYISASIGISCFPNDGKDGETLIKKADLALNIGKTNSINHYHLFTNIMDVESYKRFNLQNDIRKALENEEFFIEYQPKVDTLTRQIISAEALVRWEHPKWGTVPPNEFVSFAEESGVIIKLGEWILKNVCLQINEWKRKGLKEVPIAVNFSPIQFSDKNITDMVLKIIDETSVNPKCLEFEITENGILENYDDVMKKMTILRNHGISFSIDDFGTGYSSLKTLNRLKFDLVKIDRAFIKDLPNNEGSLQITKAIIQLAHLLEIKVVAEGVEDIQQLSILEENKCDYIQGYFFSRPVSPSEFEKLMKDSSAFTTISEPIAIQPKENRRKYFRILFKYPLAGTMTVHLFNHKQVQIGSSPILIEDIGPGGLCYVTKIKFPLNKGLVLGIDTKILDQNLTFQGRNVWCKEIDDGLYQYGFELDIDETDRSRLVQLLNQFQVKYKKDVLLPCCSFVKVSNTAQYFEQPR